MNTSEFLLQEQHSAKKIWERIIQWSSGNLPIFQNQRWEVHLSMVWFGMRKIVCIIQWWHNLALSKLPFPWSKDANVGRTVLYVLSYAIVNDVKILIKIFVRKTLLLTVRTALCRLITNICNCFYVDCIIQETFIVVKSSVFEFLFFIKIYSVIKT